VIGVVEVGKSISMGFFTLGTSLFSHAEKPRAAIKIIGL